MRIHRFFSCLGIMALLAGCYGNGSSVPTVTATTVPTHRIEPKASVTAVPTQTLEVTPSASLSGASQATAYPPETHMKSQCLDVESTPFSEIGSSGVLVLKNQGDKPGTLHLDMSSGQIAEVTKEGEGQIEPIVSPNGSFVAYEHVIYDAAGKVVKTELVVANAKGQPLSVMPWEDEWSVMPAWLDNEHVVINAAGLNPKENTGDEPDTMLALDPFSGKRQILKPDFPKILNISWSSHFVPLPFWDGWSGVIYDPTLTRAIYPRFVGDSKEMYTYAIWDPSKRRLVATLEDVFSSTISGYFPMPVWSPDGSRFVFEGFDPTADPVKMELYEVNRNGQAKQLTQLAPAAYVWDTGLSWSPDGRYIAMFLAPYTGGPSDKARAAVLDTETLDVTDYCVSVTFSGEGYGAGGPVWPPVWSPDGKQFVIMDWYEKEHRRVILVDIEKNIAAQIAEDMEPVGWMVSRQ